jgi:hypothetical protein
MKTAIGVFHSRARADEVARDLEAAGFADVRVISGPATAGAGAGSPGPLDRPGNMAGTGAYGGDDTGAREFLKIGNLSDDFRAHYTRALGRGGVLVCATAGEDRIDRAVDIMDRFDPIDVEEREGRVTPTGATGMSPLRAESSVQTGRTRGSSGPRVFVW